MAAGLLIVPHGGTIPMEILAGLLGTIVNVVAYVLVVRVTVRLWNKLME